MKKYTLNTLIFFLTINLLSSQNLDSLYVSRIPDTILSQYLHEKRAIEIQLLVYFMETESLRWQ